MPLSSISSLGSRAPLRILLVRAGDDASITFAGLAQPLRAAARILDPERLTIEVVSLEALLQPHSSHDAHLILIIADEDPLQLDAERSQMLLRHCGRAAVWGAVGAAVQWMADVGELKGLRAAAQRSQGVQNDIAGSVCWTSNLFELDGNRLTCRSGVASIDFALTLIDACFGESVQAEIMEALGVQHVRGADRRDNTLHSRIGSLPPKLVEVLQLMEANIEEPLATDDIANLVDISRRQLERQFKQFLGKVPSRYYLELRLQRAKQLLLDSHHSMVQVGLMCGFSSGSHFSTAYGALFGITPREERQRKLARIPPVFG